MPAHASLSQIYTNCRKSLSYEPFIKYSDLHLAITSYTTHLKLSYKYFTCKNLNDYNLHAVGVLIDDRAYNLTNPNPNPVEQLAA